MRNKSFVYNVDKVMKNQSDFVFLVTLFGLLIDKNITIMSYDTEFFGRKMYGKEVLVSDLVYDDICFELDLKIDNKKITFNNPYIKNFEKERLAITCSKTGDYRIDISLQEQELIDILHKIYEIIKNKYVCNYGNILELTQKELNTLNHIFDRFKNEEVVINVQENTNCITVVGKIESIDYNYISAKLVVVSQKDKYKLLIYREFVLLADKNEFVSIFLPPNKYVSICLKSIQEKTLKESLVITKISDEK